MEPLPFDIFACLLDTRMASVIVFSCKLQLKVCPGISYATVAADAHRNGRQKLAALLLDYEPRASEQVNFEFSRFYYLRCGNRFRDCILVGWILTCLSLTIRFLS